MRTIKRQSKKNKQESFTIVELRRENFSKKVVTNTVTINLIQHYQILLRLLEALVDRCLLLRPED